MHLRFITPLPELQPYVHSFWLFESEAGVPLADNRVIAPNGRAKIIIPFRNPLFTTLEGCLTEYPEQGILFIGIWDRPVTLSSPTAATGTLGIELNPQGAYRFTDRSMIELTNRILAFDDLFGAVGRRLQQRMANTPAVDAKVDLIQSFLRERLSRRNPNPLVDGSVELISESLGLLPVRELERKTGYSKRYLDLLFRDHLGISPKTLATITRFQQMYRLWASAGTPDFAAQELFDLYYDQAHFIREFRRYTGYSPGQYARARNEFGRIFYRR